MAIGAQKLLPVQLLLVSISFAAISSLDLSGSVDGSGASAITAILSFSGSEGQDAYLLVSGPVDSVVVRDRSGLVLEHRIVVSGNDTLIYATVPYDYLRFDIGSDSFTVKEGPLWGFDLGIGASENITSFTSRISLPRGTTLRSTNGAVEGDGGSLAISWKAGSVDAAHRLRMKASYEVEAPPQPDYTIPIIIGAFVLVAIAITSYLMRNRQPQRQPAPPKKQPTPLSARASPPAAPESLSPESNAVFKTLDETDKDIVREMVRQGGKTTQAHLYLHTHVPKATLSRRLASLENKGIIRKSQKGNRNLVTLTDIFDK